MFLHLIFLTFVPKLQTHGKGGQNFEKPLYISSFELKFVVLHLNKAVYIYSINALLLVILYEVLY